MPRHTLVCLLAAALLTGCGGTPDAPLSAADRTAIQKRYATFVGHLMKGKGDRACAQFSPASRKASDERAREAGVYDCGAVLDTLSGAIRDTAPEDISVRIAHPEKIIVTMNGERARAEFPGAQTGGVLQPVTLERVGKRWMIDGTRVIIAG